MSVKVGIYGEPWEFVDGEVCGHDGHPIYSIDPHTDFTLEPRIISCVNACLGMEDPEAALVRLRKVEEAARDFIAALDSAETAMMAESDACIAAIRKAEDDLRSALGEKTEGAEVT
jgi:hypothetical protein